MKTISRNNCEPVGYVPPVIRCVHVEAHSRILNDSDLDNDIEELIDGGDI